MPLPGVDVGDNLQQTPVPEPFPQGAEWILWHVEQLDMLVWLQELRDIPDQDEIQEFARRVQASFKVPKARYHATKVDND